VRFVRVVPPSGPNTCAPKYIHIKKVYTVSMPLFIKHPDADKLARQLAKQTGETITTAVVTALRERLERQPKRRGRRSLKDELRVIGKRCSKRPVLDRRSADEIIGYGRDGVPR
jgi:antitoxin VapB